MPTQRYGLHLNNRNVHPKLSLKFMSAMAFIGEEFSLSANIDKYTIINNISEKQKQQNRTHIHESMRYIQEPCNTTSYFLSCLEKQRYFSGAIMIRHILLLKFAPEIQEQQLTTIRDTAISMPHQIKGISSVIEWGGNVSSENKNKGFTHAITMTFDDQKAISNYLSHPAHDKLKNLLTDSVDDIIVFDYEI
ncbi:hypothetical protein C6H64_10605 [Photorhabdus luminescens]|nr:hypothetical protein C6H64_10605 [Photorhabdus luminescens]